MDRDEQELRRGIYTDRLNTFKSVLDGERQLLEVEVRDIATDEWTATFRTTVGVDVTLEEAEADNTIGEEWREVGKIQVVRLIGADAIAPLIEEAEEQLAALI